MLRAALFAGTYEGERIVSRSEPGTLNMFNGGRTLHRVRATYGPKERVIAVLSYDTRVAEEQAKFEAEEQAKHEAEEQAQREAEEQAKRELEEQAKREAEEQPEEPSSEPSPEPKPRQANGEGAEEHPAEGPKEDSAAEVQDLPAAAARR